MIDQNKEVPLFASRLNSMGARRDLWAGDNSVLDWIARQGTIEGLDLVDFNSPQHLKGYTTEKVKKALIRLLSRLEQFARGLPKSLKTGHLLTRSPANVKLP